jgi:cobalt-zinc-cadmium efflux system outer membrane protein
MKRTLINLLVFFVFLMPLPSLAEEKQNRILTGSITLVQALKITLRNNPDLRAFSYEIRAREAQTLQAGMIFNPILDVQVENAIGSGNFNGFDQSETTVQLRQMVELGDKRKLRKSSAKLSKEIAGWDYKVQRLRVLTRVTQSYIHVLKAQQKLSLTGERVKLAEKLLTTVSEMIKAGKVAVVEKIKTEIALANMRIEEERARMKLKNVRRQLSVLWGETKPRFDFASGDFFSVPDRPFLERKAVNPNISKWTTVLAHRQAQLDVEISKTIPNITFSGGYRRLEEMRDNTLVFGVTVPLNWFNRNQGGIANARHRLSQIQEEKKAATLKFEEGLLQAYGEVSFSHARVISIKTEILPAASKALDAMNEGYRFGKFGLLDVMDSQKTFFQVQSQYIDALVDYHNAIAEVENLTGVDPIDSTKFLRNGEGENRP